jgi:chromosomal replication initiation ATPase DnaA
MIGSGMALGSSPLNLKIERQIASDRADLTRLEVEVAALKRILAKERKALNALALKCAILEQDREAAPASPGDISAPVRLAHIVQAASEVTGITVIELKSEQRGRDIARARQIAMYCARIMTLRSLPRIGKEFHRDHTTALHATRKIEYLESVDPEVASTIKRVSEAARRIANIEFASLNGAAEEPEAG